MQANLLYAPEIRPNHWVLPHRPNFQSFIDQSLYTEPNLVNSECELFEHQLFVKNFLQPLSPYRGLLLYHSLGSGKGRSTIATCGQFSREKKVHVLLPASLAENFMKELRECAVKNHKGFGWILKTITEKRLKTMQVTREFANSQGGVWVKDDNARSDQAIPLNVKQQLEHSVKSMYSFFHYNGNDAQFQKLISEMKSDQISCFDDTIVVIDEVHNFITRVVNAKERQSITTSTKVYDQIVKAKRAKVIALSGTPLINKVIELSYLMNMIKGSIDVYTFSSPLTDVHIQYLKSNRYVDDFTYDIKTGSFSVVLMPHDFVQRKRTSTNDQKLKNSVIHISRLKLRESKSTNTIIEDIQKSLSSPNVVNTTCTILPLETSKFNNLFFDGNVAQNTRMLMTRLAGLTSHFEISEDDKPVGYPINDGLEIVKVEMSAFQAAIYQTIRKDEEAKENKFRGNNSENFHSEHQDSKNYKTFSRMACNFVFPDEHKRPTHDRRHQRKDLGVKKGKTPGTKKGNNKGGGNSVDGNEENEENEEDEDNYTKDEIQSFQHSIDAIADNTTTKYLALEHLQGDKGLSAKFARVITGINQSPGPCLVYSFFREVEGIHLLKKSLEANGYHHLDYLKNSFNFPTSKKQCFIIFTDDKVKNTQLLHVFNSDFESLELAARAQVEQYCQSFSTNECELEIDKNNHGNIVKALLITQSGAEGISLKCVREVHMIEPHWHMTRIQQVVGRAMRANSHLVLNNSERRVKSFLYLSVLKTGDGETTDEWMYKLAFSKQERLDEFMYLMKQAAVNCEKVESCFRPYVVDTREGGDLLNNESINANSAYSLFDIEKDPKDAQYAVEERIRHFIALKKFDGEQLWFDPNTLTVHREVASQNNFVKLAIDEKIIGRVFEEEGGRLRFVRTI